jgi:hypothetical protein
MATAFPSSWGNADPDPPSDNTPEGMCYTSTSEPSLTTWPMYLLHTKPAKPSLRHVNTAGNIMLFMAQAGPPDFTFTPELFRSLAALRNASTEVVLLLFPITHDPRTSV